MHKMLDTTFKVDGHVAHPLLRQKLNLVQILWIWSELCVRIALLKHATYFHLSTMDIQIQRHLLRHTEFTIALITVNVLGLFLFRGNFLNSACRDYHVSSCDFLILNHTFIFYVVSLVLFYGKCDCSQAYYWLTDILLTYEIIIA